MPRVKPKALLAVYGFLNQLLIASFPGQEIKNPNDITLREPSVTPFELLYDWHHSDILSPCAIIARHIPQKSDKPRNTVLIIAC